VLGLKARILLGLHQRAEEESRFRTGLPAADPDSLVRQLDALFQQGRGPSADSEEGASALLAFARRDFTSAAAYARTSLLAKSWESETAALEVLSLYELGRRTYGAGDPQGAKQQFREALQAALRYLAVGQSDEALRHGYFLAARGLAQVQVDRGEVSPEFLAEYQKECDKALTLNPDHPGLQEDWLAFAFLKAVREADLGRDPAPGLEQALVFLATRAREPLPVQLLAQRMLIHWRLAERSLQEGGDPFPHLAEALKGSGHTGFLPQDYLLKVLNCQARAQASRNQDPRPALREILDRFQPILEKEPTWFLKEGLAETWLIRAEWEAARHLDPSASLREARGLAESALQANVASASAYALMGLAWVQEMRWNPARRSLLLLLARDRLRLSAAVSPSGRLQARLRKALGSR
jgi:hypothetical protein